MDSGRVFTAADGSGLHPASVSEWFEQLVREADLPPIRLSGHLHLGIRPVGAAGCAGRRRADGRCGALDRVRFLDHRLQEPWFTPWSIGFAARYARIP